MAGGRAPLLRRPEVIELAQVAKPVPGDDEVLVKVHAAAVNPLDYHYLRGKPYVMRLASGIGRPAKSVSAWTTPARSRPWPERHAFRPGDAVFGGRSGALAEYVVAPTTARSLRSRQRSFEQAAGAGIAGVTALQALRDKGGVQPGQKVLVNGASGGVGTSRCRSARRSAPR